ncbi:MAG: fumarylacetoacetate hydrolase family protein [Acetobacteraceae bacterium]|nr:fumarylacetoacetate hydrolase family protein [Acetobacteraceae bacterium]MDW8398270.1 fumarylacetoacetate hydrolase family protein [Acetobacteraceae bacterium]
MRLASFEDAAGAWIGVLKGGTVRDVAAADPALPRDMLGVVAGGAALLARLAAAADAAPALPLAAVRLLPPIPRPPRNLFCVGKNYREHAKEFAASGFDATAKEVVPEAPVVFSKPPSSVIGPGEAIPSFLDPTASVDYEGELAVVIGTGGRGIPRAEAMRHVFGYTIVNDVTSRTLQHRHRQWLLGKGMDGFCPMGPAILTADEVPDPGAMRLSTWVNGALRQDARLAELIFDIPTLIATISAGITLEPGDIIATGTPAGVGIGFTPPRYLVPGDVVRITVSGIGTLENPVA